jgi:hypothetical protein
VRLLIARHAPFRRCIFTCIVGFFSIWLIFDISDNISLSQRRRLGLFLPRRVATQVPQVFIILCQFPFVAPLLPGRVASDRSCVDADTAGVVFRAFFCR